MSFESVGPDINIGGRALGTIWTLNAIAITVVIARCSTQRFVSRQLGLSDALVVISMCTITSMAALIQVQYHYGWGRHYVYLDLEDSTQALKYNAIGQAFGVMGSTFGRLSFIILMLQLFGTSKWRRRGLWGLFCAQIIPNSIVVVILYVQCADVRALWDFTIQTSCWPESVQTYLGYAHSSWNGITDLFLTCLPATMLWSLQMNRRTKFGLVFLLSLSVLAFIGVIMKIVYLSALAHRGDYTYNTVPLFTWVQVESTLVVIASSVPLLRPLFLHIKSSSSRKSTLPTFEMSDYSKKKSLASNHVFSIISDDEGSAQKEKHVANNEDCILPMQQPPNQQQFWTGIKKEVTYSVRVSEAREEDLDPDVENANANGYNGNDRDLSTPWAQRRVDRRASKGSVKMVRNAP